MDTHYIWERLTTRDGAVAYTINRELPQVQMVYSKLDQDARRTFETLMQTIEQNFPASRIYLDVAGGEISQPTEDLEKMKSDIEAHLSQAASIGLSRDELLTILLNTEPYSKFDELRQSFQRGDS